MKQKETITTSENIKLIIGNRVKSLRAKNGISVRECAARVGISARAFSDIEHGRSEPRATTLVNLAILFGVSVDLICGRNAHSVE